MVNIFQKMVDVFQTLVNIFQKMDNIFQTLVNIFTVEFTAKTDVDSKIKILKILC